jgi:hypothetical protein
MPFNNEEIKALPPEEKLKLIHKLWKSMEESEETGEDVRLRERLEAYERGELAFIS